MARSTFSQLGLPIGENNTNMTYLYGLSDFFTVMFEDPEKVNLLVEAGAVACSEAYSKFLQLTSTVSLEDIQRTIGHTIKLVTIKTSDEVEGEVNTFKLNGSILSSRYIANKPLLPTTIFEENVDYRLEPQTDGTVNIRFAKDISNAGFPTRLLSDGVVKEYALWFVDCEIDEQLISKYFGNLVGLDPQASTEVFKNFVYGLYYVYINGPVLDLIRKGLNLALGIPLCRGTETVLEIRKYLDTDQYIVVTDSNQYVIPYGIYPVVEEGQLLQVSDELARWVEVKDYKSDGEWWINLQIPPSIIPGYSFQGQKDRYATAGSKFDYLMRTYLKKHTFLVNVKVTSFKGGQIFQEISKIIHKAKPAYTNPIYIWTIYEEEVVDIDDDLFMARIDQFRCENLNQPIEKFFRNNAAEPLYRGCPVFTRYNAPMYVTRICGTDPYTNGSVDTSIFGIFSGYVNPVRQYRYNTDQETAWIRSVLQRGSEAVTGSRSRIGFTREIHRIPDSIIKHSGQPVSVLHDMADVPRGLRIIPLYLTTQKDLQHKCDNLGLRTPSKVEWTFEFLNVDKISEEINSLSINEGIINPQLLKLKDNFDIAFNRGADVNYLSNIIPQNGYTTWTPPDATYVKDGDYILGVRVCDNVIGMYWVTSNFEIEVPYYFPIKESDDAMIEINTRPNRGMAVTGSPYYVLRGRGSSEYNDTKLDINGNAINEGGEAAGILVVNPYSDTINDTQINFTRDGTLSLKHQMELN